VRGKRKEETEKKYNTTAFMYFNPWGNAGIKEP
jgi:hypothetical protein